MDERTHRVVLHLESGARIITEQAFPQDFEEEEVKQAVVARIENRESPWKFIGHAGANFKSIIAFEVEAL